MERFFRLSSKVLFVAMLMVPISAYAALYNASDLLGQNDHTDSTPDYTQSSSNTGDSYGFNGPSGTALDPVSHRLFVSDQKNDRVLVFQLDQNNDIATSGADYVLGEPDFVTDTFADGNGVATSLYKPEGLAYDSTHQRLFVADEPNNGDSRVMVFNVATSTIENGESADFELGQVDLNTEGASSHSASTFAFDNHDYDGLAYDPTNQRLFVSDDVNGRVMVFNVATSHISDGEPADYALGAADPSSEGDETLNSNGISVPTGLAFDTVGQRLFVSDQGNSRVTVFNVDPAYISNDEPADDVLGEPDFSTANFDTDQSSVSTVSGIAYDPTYGRLFVGDDGNDRVLVFDASISTLLATPMGEAAENVLGQPDYGTFNGGTSQNQFNGGNLYLGLTYDPTNHNLFVSDQKNNRVMLFNFITISTPSLPSGTNGTAYSQSISTTGTQGDTQTFSLFSGTLPAGLSLNTSTGLISGTPTAVTTSAITIEARDNFANDDASTGLFFDRSTFTLTIGGGGSPSLSITPTTLTTNGTVGTAYSQTLTMSGVSGGTNTWSLLSGSLPSGVTLNTSSTLNTTTLSGTPTSSGTFNFTVQVTNGGSTGTQALSLTINTASSGGGNNNQQTPTYAGNGPPASTTLGMSIQTPFQYWTLLQQQITKSTSPVSSQTQASFMFENNLSIGMTSPDVLALQKYLNSHGFILATSGAGSPGKETSLFGALTYKAMKAFQASVHLPSTGFFGPMTRGYINGLNH